MRIRCIKPEFWADEQIAGWSPMSRLAYIALWNEADDQGRVRANTVYLKSRLFPYDDLDMAEVLRPVIEDGKLQVYAVDGQTFGYLPRFNSHQVINRPSPSKLPPPPDSVSTHGALTEHSHQERNREQGKERNREQGTAKKLASSPCVKPELSEVEAYASEIGLPTTEAARFFDYYTGNGWRVGKNPMKDWRASLRNWKRTYDERMAGSKANQQSGRITGEPGRYANAAVKL